MFVCMYVCTMHSTLYVIRSALTIGKGPKKKVAPNKKLTLQSTTLSKCSRSGIVHYFCNTIYIWFFTFWYEIFHQIPFLLALRFSLKIIIINTIVIVVFFFFFVKLLLSIQFQILLVYDVISYLQISPKRYCGIISITKLGFWTKWQLFVHACYGNRLPANNTLMVILNMQLVVVVIFIVLFFFSIFNDYFCFNNNALAQKRSNEV